jgi:phytol kinase
MVPLPPLQEAMWLGAVGLGWGLAVGLLAGWLNQRRGVRTGFTRKIFHFLVFGGAAAAHLHGGFPSVNAYASGVVAVILFGIWRGDGDLLFEALARERDAPHRRFFVIVPLITTALGGLTSNLLFADFALVGYLVTGCGDAVGEPVGTAFGKHRYRVPTLRGKPAERTLEGSVAVAVVGGLAAVLGLHLMGGMAPQTAWMLGAVIGLVCMVVEAISPRGSDNFTTMVAASGLAAWLS